jgi:putative ABC transport system permease protein
VVGITEDFELAPTDDAEISDPPVFLATSDSASTSWRVMAIGSHATPASVLPLQTRIRDALPPGWRASARSFTEQLDAQVGLLGYFTKIFGVLGFAALALGALGVFSVLTYVVGQREREFAMRVSLGASPANLVRVVMRNALEFALGGTAIGALLSFWASAGISGLLFGVKNTDPISLIATEVILVSVTLLASLAPALRAARANPLDVMRAS